MYPFPKKELPLYQKAAFFIACFYTPYFLQTSILIFAPRLDHEFLQNMVELGNIQGYELCGKIVKKSILDHSLYLSGEMIPVALCDNSLNDSVKEEIAVKTYFLKRENLLDSTKKPKFATELKSSLADYVNEDSFFIFELLNLKYDWLIEDPKQWEQNSDFQTFKSFVTSIQCTNDPAERCVKLTSDFVNVKKIESQRQATFLVAADHKKKINLKNFTKSNLVDSFSSKK